jgi:beta-lactamase regulating signal transducer with metallopeptidase domain
MALIADPYPLLLAGWVAVAMTMLSSAFHATARRDAEPGRDPAWQYARLIARIASAAAFVPAASILLNHAIGHAATHAPVNRQLRGIAGDLSDILNTTTVTGVLLAIGMACAAGVAVRFVQLALALRAERRLWRAALPAPLALQERVDDIRRQLGIVRRIVVRVGRVDTPMVIGRRRPRIVVPEFLWYDSAPHCDALLMHELAHVQRGDGWSNLALAIASVLLWWDPSVRRSVRAARCAREFACDDVVARRFGSPQILVEALVTLAEVRVAAGGRTLSLASPHGNQAARPAPPVGHSVARASCAAVAHAVAAIAIFTVVNVAAGAHDDTTRSFARSWISPPTAITVTAHDPAGAFALRIVRGKIERVTLNATPVPRTLVVVTGDSVAIRDSTGLPVLTLALDPRGAIHWEPRATPSQGAAMSALHDAGLQ